MTILLNTGCTDLRSVPGASFWLAWPLPYTQGGGDFFEQWEPPPSAAGTYYRTTFVPRCRRILLCEGAVHNGTTYTSLGTVSTWLLAKATPPASAPRPEWMRGEKDTRRWTGPNFDPTLQYAEGRHHRPGPDEDGRAAWIEGGTTSFDVTSSTARQRLYDALIAPQVNGPGATLAAAAGAGAGSVCFSGSAAGHAHNAGGIAASPALRLRIGTDATIYTASSITWDAGSGWWSAAISPALQAAADSGASVTWLAGIPMPPDLPHDLLLEATVYKYVKMSKVREVIPDSDPVAYRWQTGSKTILVSAEAGIRIQPWLYYWKCEPRAYYAAP